MTKIAIAGLGWLGLNLAVHLQQAGYAVKGSVTNRKKQNLYTKNGLPTFQIVLNEDGIQGNASSLLDEAPILVILIPPGLRRNTGHNYALKMLHFVNALEKSDVKKVILVSSTSVYGDQQGCVTELDLPTPTTNSGKQLLEVEQLFVSGIGFTTTIVRFGGLFGGTRNPVKYLAGRKELSNGDAPVNLIHREDCIAILMAIIEQDAFGYIINGVAPEHPSKKSYYSNQAKKLGLEPPTYKKETESTFKQVDSVNLKNVLNYTFKVSLTA